ncbi:hypothetical protein [Burkholderia gladioli]|uniref:hypothetical protein n=1 Tax=Burkholderia gladioli TaxID=28095 RepID=UPI00163E2B0F|nr:hypothetical protein [Burkholderia gladioli]
MSIIIAFIVAHLGGVLTVLGGLVAVGVAWFHGKSTGSAQAAQAAAGQVATAQAAAQSAQSQTADAQAQTAAVRAGADAVAARAAIDNDVSAKPAQEVRNELQNDWTRR